MTFRFAIDEITSISVAQRPDLHPLAVLHVPAPVTSVYLAVGHALNAFAIFHTVQEIAFVDGPVRVSHFVLAVLVALVAIALCVVVLCFLIARVWPGSVISFVVQLMPFTAPSFELNASDTDWLLSFRFRLFARQLIRI